MFERNFVMVYYHGSDGKLLTEALCVIKLHFLVFEDLCFFIGSGGGCIRLSVV